MLNNISNEDHILNNSIAQQAKLAGVDKKTAAQNPYSKVAEYADVIDISEQAKKLYEKDQEIQKYKSMVMDSLNIPDTLEQVNSVLDTIKTGDYISNDSLADKMLKNNTNLDGSELLKILFSESHISAENPFADLLPSESQNSDNVE